MDGFYLERIRLVFQFEGMVCVVVQRQSVLGRVGSQIEFEDGSGVEMFQESRQKVEECVVRLQNGDFVLKEVMDIRGGKQWFGNLILKILWREGQREIQRKRNNLSFRLDSDSRISS